MRKVNITVLKKEFYPDFAEEYLTYGIRPVVFKTEVMNDATE